MQRNPQRPHRGPLARTLLHRLLGGSFLLVAAFLIFSGCADEAAPTEVEQDDLAPSIAEQQRASASPTGAPTERHFLMWNVAPQPRENHPVALKGQFDTNHRKASVRQMVRLINPALKIHDGREYPILDRDEHLTEYLIATPRDPERIVYFKNQFGTQRWKLTRAVSLLVPAQKQGHKYPQRLDHYKCYTAEAQFPLNVVIGVSDQFIELVRTRLGKGLMFCVPVEKVHRDRVFPIQNPESHLAIYAMRTLDRPDFRIRVRDQFRKRIVTVLKANRFVVESEKLAWSVTGSHDADSTGADAEGLEESGDVADDVTLD